MSDSLDPKEAKTLSDILALVLDEQAVSESALRKLRERAAADRISAGALKNIFVRLASSQGPLPDRLPAEIATLRETVAEQASSIRALHQQIRITQTRLGEAIAARDQLADAVAGRRLRLFFGLGIAAAGSALLAGLVGWWLGDHPASPLPVPPLAARTPPAAPPAPLPAGAVVIVPPHRDPDDTAPQPEYPAEAKRRGEQGTVGLLVHIDADGHVSGIGVSQSAGANLDVAAQQAVSQWKFRPGLRDGRPVDSQMMLRFSFILKQ